MDKLKKKLRDVRDRANEMVNKIKEENRGFSADEQKEFDGLLAQAQALRNTIDGGEDFESLNNELNKTVTKLDFGPVGKTNGRNSAQNRNHRLYQNMFPGATDNGQFKTADEFMNVVVSGRFDERLMSFVNAASGNSGVDGGYAMPTGYSKNLFDRSLENEIVRPRANVWGMETGDRVVPAFNSDDLTNDVYGFTGQWLGELQEANVDTPKLKQVKHVARKLAIFTAASRELSEDGADYNAQLEVAMTSAIGYFLDKAFFISDGVGKPLGILKSACTLKVARTTTTGYVEYADIAKMYGKLLPGSYKTAVWVVNQTAVPALCIMKDPAGSYIWEPGKPLMGIPVVVTEKTPLYGQAGDIILADFSCYSIGMRKEIIVDKCNAVGWTKDQIDIRAIIRVSGMPVFEKPIKQETGNEVSPFVVLNTEGVS